MTKPALTPEEWKNGVRRRGFTGLLRGQALDGTGRVGIEVHAYPLGGTGESDELHALAALCLHGQPFGFDWADVDALRTVAPTFQKLSVRPVFPPQGEQVEMMRQVTGVAGKIGRYGDTLADLADRIAALLPPRPQP